MDPHLLALILFFLIAALYSSVGHAGASGYLAIMALLSFAPDEIKPTSLVLNIAVAGIASWRYLRAGCFDGKVFWPLALVAIPFAFVGGALELPARMFQVAAGIFLVASAAIMAWRAFRQAEVEDARRLNWPKAALIAAPIGFVSGIIGVGGGIFLSPILIAGRYAPVRTVSGIAALFILVNSVAGLIGQFSTGLVLHSDVLHWLIAVIGGGLLGSHLGLSRFGTRAILVVLLLVLLTAGSKMLLA